MTVDTDTEKAIRDYFNKPGFARFLNQLQRRYVASSSGGRGYVTLQKITEDERRVLDEFYETYSPPNPQETKRYSIAVFKRLLENSRFTLTLPELFRVLNGEQARTRLEQKAIDDAEWEKLIHEAINILLLKEASGKVVAWAEGLCDESSPGARTLRKVFANSRQEAAYCLNQALKALLMVTEGSHAVPIRLPILSAKVTGDAHSLDWKYPLGRLFWWGLTSVCNGRVEGNENSLGEAALFETEEADVEEDMTQSQILSHAILLREGYRQGGIADDDISSQVMVFAPALWGVWEERIITLRQVERLRKEHIVGLESTCIYVVENPSVFAELVDAALVRRAQKDRCPLPFFICGNGQPTVAVIKLLDLLCGVVGLHLYYAGDLDSKGLSIAQSLQIRYSHAFKDWRMNTEQYLRYVKKGVPLVDGERSKLRNTEFSWDRDLGSAMADRGSKLHQELWVGELVSDWLNSNTESTR